MIYAIDFDGVLCENAYPDIGEPNYLALGAVKRLRELGHTVILWTCRHDDELDAALEWLRGLGIEFDYVNENVPWLIDEFGDCRKIAADRYIDDKIPGWEWEGVLEEAFRNQIIPTLVKYQCWGCDREFIASEAYDPPTRCLYCGIGDIDAVALLDDQERLEDLGCMAISGEGLVGFCERMGIELKR